MKYNMSDIIKKVYELYDLYIKQCEIIDFFIKHDPKKNYRRPNFPEVVSEYLAHVYLNKNRCSNRYVKSGDLECDGKSVQVKCFASNGPISFGPKTTWEEIIFLDARKTSKIDIYGYKGSHEKFKTIKFSKTQTFEDQCKLGRRPRITPNALFKEIKPTLYYSGTVLDLLSGIFKDNDVYVVCWFDDSYKIHSKTLKTYNKAYEFHETLFQ